MATVTGYTAERMKNIEDSAIVAGHVDGDDLILTPYGNAADPVNYPEINAGDVRGPIGTPGVTSEEFDDFILGVTPVGAVCDYIGATEPTKWKFLNGQTLTNAQSLYPELWAIAPASMKSGSNLVLPDARGRFVVGVNSDDAIMDTVGETGGSKNAIVVAHTHNGPSHTHTGPSHTHTSAAHTHTSAAHTHSTPNHTHSISHDHASFSTGSGGGHTHRMNEGPYQYYGYVMVRDIDPLNRYFPAGGEDITALIQMAVGTRQVPGALELQYRAFPVVESSGSEHTHSINVPAFSGNTPSGGGSTTGSTTPGATGSTTPGPTGAAGTGNTGASGTGETSSTGVTGTNANLPPYLALNKIIRVAA